MRVQALGIGAGEYRQRTVCEPNQSGAVSEGRRSLLHSARFQGGAPPEHVLAIVPLCQGQTNGCGTTSLAMALNFLSRLRSPQGSLFTREHLDAGNRELDSFSAPGMLVRLGRSLGFYADMYNHAGFEEIREHLLANHPILALHDADPSRRESPASLHYVVIHGYREGHGGPELLMTDPALPPGRQSQWLTYKTFSEAHWNDIQMAGVPTGMNRLMLVFSNHADLPPERDVPPQVAWATWLNDGINQFSSWLRKIIGS